MFAAPASGVRVVLVRPATKVAWSEEVLTRAAGELRAAGFEPVLVDAAPGEDVRATFRRTDPSAIAVISIAPDAAEVWVEDRLTGKISIRPTRTADDAHRLAADLAIESVELLRASLIELTVRSRDAFASKEPPRAAVAFAEAALPGKRVASPEGGGFRFGAGVAPFVGFDPPAVLFAPLFEAGFSSQMGLGGRVRFVGPGAGPDIAAPRGAVSWSSWVLAAGPTFAAPISTRWFLRGSLDGGLFHLTARGELSPPAESREGSSLVAAFLGGGALGFVITEHVSVTLGLEALVTAPPPTVVVGGETIATVGRPWLLVPLALEIAP